MSLSRQTNTIGVIIPGVENPFFVGVLDGVEAIARLYDYYVVICLTYGNKSRQVSSLRLLADGRVDGILLHGPDLKLPNEPEKRGIDKPTPFVIFDYSSKYCSDTSILAPDWLQNDLVAPFSASTYQSAYSIGKAAAETLVQVMARNDFADYGPTRKR